MHFRSSNITLTMAEFNASSVAYEVQKCFSNKFFSNKLVAMNLIEDSTVRLLDDLFLLLHAHVSRMISGQVLTTFHIISASRPKTRKILRKQQKT